MNEDWKENPELKNMDKSKLDMLQQLADQGVGKNPSDMLPFLMEAASRGKKNGLNFSQPEISAILEKLPRFQDFQPAIKHVNLRHR